MKSSVSQTKGRIVKYSLVYSILLAFFLVSLLSQPVWARQTPSESPAPAMIKYLGIVQEQLLFNVDIENKNAERCRIVIQDEHGEVFYKQDFKGDRFAKTFGINKAEIEGKNLVFILVKGKARHEHVFHVSTNTRVVEDVVVAKL